MDNNVGNEVPWASVFDSTANMRALTAIQAEGLRAASKLVDRFIAAASDSVNTLGGTMGSRSALSPDQRADLWGATDIEPLLKSWFAMVNQLGRGGTPTAGTPGPPTLEFGDDTAAGRLDVEVLVGAVTTTEIWVSNRDAGDVGTVRLRVSALESDAGEVCNPGDVALLPDTVEMPGRSSRAVDLRIRAECAPGVYRGSLFTVGRPELWLPITLTVRELPA
ncbi:hypothetical protein [Mycobacterium sp. C31M]